MRDAFGTAATSATIASLAVVENGVVLLSDV
jgi:hypothetical protein